VIHIEDFTISHIEQAQQIAFQNYNEERRHVPALPPIDATPDLTSFAENGLGVAAFEGDKMVGFLCCVSPFKNAFRSTDAVGVFSPMHANGTVPENRAAIYARMYQAAGDKWAKAGASSHAVCLYAHDKEAQEQFFKYGFGMRCVDAIRGMDPIKAPVCAEYDIAELNPDEFLQILPLEHMLDAHMAASPCFILRPSITEKSFIEESAHYHSIYIAARQQGRIVAYIRAELDGETFICGTPGYLHVKGAFCLPEHRGKGMYQNLLNTLVQKLKNKGYTRLGVDFESINPTAYGFWLKYFDAYTHSVVRRIDEHAITKQKQVMPHLE
jgi:GNAT superfamily N-acetyltransferase